MPVAVLIVNYRVYRDLDAGLAALAPFLGADDEVVVVDQDSAPDELAALASRHPRVRFIAKSDNRGFAAGINEAARHTRAPFLLWLNPDAVIEGPVVRTLEAWLSAHPDTAAVGPRVLDADGAVQQSARRFPGPTTAIAGRSTWLSRRFPANWLSRRNLLAAGRTEPGDVDWVAGSCVMTSRTVFDQLGGLDEQFFLYWEDADYCRRAGRLGFRCTYLPTVSVRHAGGQSVQTDPAPAIRAFHKSAFRLFHKHSGPVGRGVAPLVRAGLWLRGEVLARRALRRGRQTS